MPQWFCLLPTENITAKHIVSNDSSDSDDEAQAPKGKRGKASEWIVSRGGESMAQPLSVASMLMRFQVLKCQDGGCPVRDRTFA